MYVCVCLCVCEEQRFIFWCSFIYAGSIHSNNLFLTVKLAVCYTCDQIPYKKIDSDTAVILALAHLYILIKTIVQLLRFNTKIQ